MTTKNLLVELFVEELPPKALKKLGDAFAGVLLEQLKAHGLTGAESVLTPFASPRRLAAHITDVASQAVDKAVIGPVARAYGESVPRPIRKGLRNFLFNLREPVVFLNYMLQLKPGKAAETVGRFAINSTIGIAGVLDQAKRKPFNLPRRRNGFANTMGYYGVKSGPFFYLPLIGPTTLRDFFGTVVDQVELDLHAGQRPFEIEAGVAQHRREDVETAPDLLPVLRPVLAGECPVVHLFAHRAPPSPPASMISWTSRRRTGRTRRDTREVSACVVYLPCSWPSQSRRRAAGPLC